MPKIYYTPFDNAVNAYTQRMKFILSNYGKVHRIDKHSIMNKIFKFNFNDVIVVNWLENIMINKKGNISLLGLVKLFAIFICFRMIFRRFIYVRHNHYPHSCNLKSSKRAKKILDFLENIPHFTLVHSEVEAKGKRIYMPHPLYNIAYKSSRANVDNKKLIIFGSISRYKKIEAVIESLPDNLYLLVIGGCNDADYLNYLNSLKKDKKNIEIIPEYVSDEKVQELINSARGMLITHNDDDMIVSGSFFYAISIRAKTYVLETPFFNWVSQELGERHIKVSSNLEQMFSDIIYESELTNANNAKSPEDLFSDEIIISKFNQLLN